MTQYARIELKSCPMFDPNCFAKVVSHVESMMTRNAYGELTVNVPELIEKQCGRYTRGTHKGEIRGYAHLEVCTVGGWHKLGPGEGNGRVVYPGSIISLSIKDFSGKQFFAI